MIYKFEKKLSLPGLIVGSMFPDLEIPIIILLFGTRIPGNRLVLHSLLGAATVGTMFSMAFTVLIYPLLINGFFKIRKEKVKNKFKPSFVLIFSCFLGNLSHVLLDIVNHPLNPIFWPFQSPTLSPIVVILGGTDKASMIVSSVLIVLFIVLIVYQRGNLEKLLVEDIT